MCSIQKAEHSPPPASLADIMATKGSLGQISKSKAKKLNRKAKCQRMETASHQEKRMRVSALNTTKHWKNKAFLYKRLNT